MQARAFCKPPPFTPHGPAKAHILSRASLASSISCSCCGKIRIRCTAGGGWCVAGMCMISLRACGNGPTLHHQRRGSWALTALSFCESFRSRHSTRSAWDAKRTQTRRAGG